MRVGLHRRSRQTIAAATVTTLAGAFFLWWEYMHRGTYAYNTGVYPLDPADEWRYTACSRLVAHGYHLFSQVYSAQPPGLFLSLAAGMRLLGETLAAARSVEAAYGLLTLLASAWLAARLGGPPAGAVAAALLSVSAGFLVYAHTVEAEMPMMALEVLALALVAEGSVRRRERYVVLGGLVLGAAILTKLFALEALAPALWLGVYGRHRDRGTARVLAMFLGAVFVPIVLEFALVAPADQWAQVVTLHSRVASLALPNLMPATDVLRRFLTLDPGLTLLAAVGPLVLSLCRRRRDAGFVVLWVGGTLLMLWRFTPLFPHHAAILSAPLAVCAALGVATLAGAAQGHSRPSLAALIVLAVAYLLGVPSLAHADRHVLGVSAEPSALPLAQWIEAHSPPSAMVAADNVEVDVGANRLEPPPLCDPSRVRAAAGDLTANDLIAATTRFRPLLVVPEPGGVYASAPGYIRWLRARYRPEKGPSSVRVYRRGG